MTKTLTKLAALGAVIASTSLANAITLTDPGVVGIYNGALANANPETVTPAAQHLLDMLANTIDGNYQTGPTEYSGILTFFSKTENKTPDAPGSVPAGHDYVMAKYDGQGGGYVLWALDGNAFTLPGKSGYDGSGLWLNNQGPNGQGKGLTHWIVFDSEETRVPDGGATVALLGIGLLGLGAMRRKLS